MKMILYISLILSLFSCKKNKTEILNLNNNRIDVLGHAGMGISSLYPINSGESLLACLYSGANGTEIDVQLTKDNVLVAFHDNTLDDKTNLSGIIREHNWSDLAEGTYNSTPYLGYKLVKINDLFNNLENFQNYIFTFDIKINPSSSESIDDYLDDYTDAILTLYSVYDIHSHSFIEAQYTPFIMLLASKDAQIKQFIYPQVFEDGLSIAQELNLFGITISNDKINMEQVKVAHDQGYFVTIWGPNSNSSNEDAVSKSPDMIQTDKLNHLIKHLE